MLNYYTFLSVMYTVVDAFVLILLVQKLNLIYNKVGRVEDSFTVFFAAVVEQKIP